MSKPILIGVLAVLGSAAAIPFANTHASGKPAPTRRAVLQKVMHTETGILVGRGVNTNGDDYIKFKVGSNVLNLVVGNVHQAYLVQGNNRIYPHSYGTDFNASLNQPRAVAEKQNLLARFATYQSGQQITLIMFEPQSAPFQTASTRTANRRVVDIP